MLDQVLRQAGTDSLTCILWELLLHLREGDLTQEDWQTLLKCSRPNAENEREFTNVIHLFNDILSVAQFNQD